MRFLPVVGTLALSLSLLSMPVAAGGAYSVDATWVQTRDGSAWAEGQPITLVVRATSTGAEFPASALSVVMQTDGERTKCLNVAMKLVSTDGGVATYAGIFHPFRAATYDGKFGIGEDVHDVRFTVGAAPARPATIPADAELPVLPLVTFDYEPTLLDRLAIGGISLGAAAAFAVAAIRRRPRIALAV